MVSLNKLSKTDKRHHWGRDGKFLKDKGKLKYICMFNSAIRKKLKSELKNELENGE